MDTNRIGLSLLAIHKLASSESKLWESTDNGFYQLTFPNSSVQVGFDLDPDVGEQYPFVRFYNKNGIQILEVHGGNLSKYIDKTYQFLQEIVDGARDSTLLTDDTFIDIINSISKTKGEKDD